MRLSPAREFSGAPRGARVQTRVSLVLAATAVMFTVVMLVMQNSQQGQVEVMLRERAAETQRVLGRIIDLRASGARIHADDYTRWDDFVAFVRTRDPEWARINLTESIHTFGLDAAWVLDERFEPVFTVNPEKAPQFEELPAPADALARLLARTPISHFFTSTPLGVLEIWTSSIHPSDDFRRATPSRGYYLAGRLWTPERIAELASVAGGEVRIVPAQGFRPGTRGGVQSGRIEVRTPFTGIDGHPVAGLVFSTPFVVGQHVNKALRTSSLLAMLGAMLALVLVWGALAHWVGRPLSTITRAMQREDASLLAGVLPRRDELGQVARLVDEFFVQRDHLIEAREAAQAAVIAKSHFLANISHELRTPMHGILSFSRFGMRDAQTAPRDDLHDDFRQINECGESLLTLLNALLDLSKLEAGRMPFSFSDVLLPDVIDVAMDEFRSLYQERQIELRAEVEPGLPPVVADRDRMLQVLRNLISNAAKFTPAGGSVVVRVASAGTSQRVVVEDSGVGIPAGEEDLIFHRFTQASHTSPRTGATGLGLAISRELIEAHEGRVWAENREGGGARLVFEVPVEGPAAARESRGNDESSTAVRTSVRIVTPGPASNANDRWRRVA